MTPEAADAGERNLGWRVVFAGLGINLALGILYTWSVFKPHFPADWTKFERTLPYALACVIFSLVMVPAGRMQDKLSPRLTATIGGVLVGIGMILAGLTEPSLLWYVIGFGVLAGAGIGFGYASATPPAVKWFPAAKTGMIAGIVVSGFGLASVYAAPLANWLISEYGLQKAMTLLGGAFLVIVVILAQFLKAPHRVMQFTKKLGPAGEMRAQANAPVKKENFAPTEMLKTWQFYLIWFIYACGAGAGLMVISIAMGLGKAKAGVLAVVTLALGNGIGRILAGMLSDKIGRKATLVIFLLFQAVMVFLLSLARPDTALGSAAALAVIAALVGANYGSNLALFPSMTKDFYGLKNFGVNYGLVFTAWGLGGFMLAQGASALYDKYQTYTYAFYGAAALLIVAACVVLLLKPPHHTEEAPAPEASA